MADFVQSANIKSASRTLANSIADVATFGKNEHVKNVFWTFFLS